MDFGRASHRCQSQRDPAGPDRVYEKLSMAEPLSQMLFRFRICRDPDKPDDAQGWVIAESELGARSFLGCDAQVALQSRQHFEGAPDGTVFVTMGRLPDPVH